MPTVYLTQPGLQARVTSSRLELDTSDVEGGRGTTPPWIPLVDVELVVLDSRVRFSAHAISGLLRKNIPVFFLSHRKFPAGMAVPMRRQTGGLARQLDVSRDEQLRLEAARWIIEAKIRNMRRMLQRLGERQQFAATVALLKRHAGLARKATSLDSLRGYEGSATGQYFSVLAQCFPEEMPFVRRSRRPPRNEVNALLSYLYTVLCGEISLHLYGMGLEPGWGIFHENVEGRPALALDIMEPFRAPLVDALVVDMVNHSRIKPEDFEQHEEGWLLRQESRRKVFLQWENRLEREFNYTRENRRTTLRSLLKEQCRQIRTFFKEGKPLRPFRMN